MVFSRIPGKGIEKVRDVLAYEWVACQVTMIGIEFSCDSIIVSCAHVHIILDAFFFGSDHKAHLGMGLAPWKTVSHINPFALKFLCPTYIILLVKARFKFHQDCYLFSPVCCLHKGLNNSRIVINPV